MSVDERREAAPQVLDTIPEGFVPDTAESYPQEKLYPAFLPSGAKVLLRKSNPVTLMSRGDIPNPLMAVVNKLFQDEGAVRGALDLQTRADEAGRTLDEQQEWERENLPPDDEDPAAEDFGSMVNLLVWSCFAQPTLTHDPPAEKGGRLSSNGELCLSAIPDEDKMFVFAWATSDFDGAATFLADRASGSGEHDGGTLRPEAERSASDTEHADDGVAPVLP